MHEEMATDIMEQGNMTMPSWSAVNCSLEVHYNEVCDPNLLRLRRAVYLLDLYLLPVIIFLGMIGNILSFLVFCCTYLRRMSSSVYLAALSVSDFVFLFALFFTWITTLDINVVSMNGLCQFLIYLTYVTSFLSVWYVVCFTVERHLSVCFPLLRQRLCQPRRAKIVVLVLSILGMIIYNFALWTSVVTDVYGHSQCIVDDRYFDVVITINNIDTLVTLVVPALVITVSNIRISYALSKFYRFYRTRCSAERLNSNSGSSLSSDCSTLYSNSSYNRLQMKVTKMLLLVSSVFLLCNIPSHLIRVYAFARSRNDVNYSPSRTLLLIQRLAMLLYYAGFSTNVVLYSVSGKTFRLAFVRLFHCLAHRAVNFFCARLVRSKSRFADADAKHMFRFQNRAPPYCAAYN